MDDKFSTSLQYRLKLSPYIYIKPYFLEARVEVLWFSLFVYYQNKIFKLFKYRSRASGFCFNVCVALAIQHNPSAAPAPNNPLLLEAKVKSQN